MKRAFIVILCILIVSTSWALPRGGIYLNGVVGFGCCYPDIFSASKNLKDDQGIFLTSSDNSYELLICGSSNEREQHGLQMLKERLHYLSQPEFFVGTMTDYSIVYHDRDRIIYEYRVVNPNVWASFLFAYPEEEAGQWDKIIDSMKEKLLLH